MTSSGVAHERQPLLAPTIDRGETLPAPEYVTIADVHSSSAEDLPSAPQLSWSDIFETAAAMYCFFYIGIIATAAGTLLDKVEAYYAIQDSIAGLMFPTAITGYVLAAMFLPYVVSRLGWRGMATISPVFHLLAVIVQSFGLPFPIILTAQFLAGIGCGLSDSGFNAWASKHRLANIVQGFIHSAFAVGCIVGPILTLPVTRRHLPWYTFYRGMILLAAVEVIILSFAFRKKGALRVEDAKVFTNATESSKFEALKLIAFCSLFFFTYIGAECSYSTWLVSFMKRVRGFDDTDAALSSSIFWGGMAVGRATLGPVTEYIGIKLAVSCYIMSAVCLQVLFLLVRTTITSFVMLAAIGICMAPMFPSAVILIGRKLPPREALAVVSVAVSVGQIGGALMPSVIGLMADTFGLKYLPNVTLCLLALLPFIWIPFARIGETIQDLICE